MNRFKTLVSISFLLAFDTVLAATLSGVVTEAGTGAPIPNAVVAIWDPAFGVPEPLDQVATDGAGSYTITFTVDPSANPVQPGAPGVPALTTGQILVEVMAPNHAPQRAGDPTGLVKCFWFCEGSSRGSTVSTGLINASDTDALVQDFALEPGARLAGSVTEASGGSLANVPIVIFTRDNLEAMTAFKDLFFTSSGPPGLATDGIGNYLSAYALPAGQYFVGAGVDSPLSNFEVSSLPYGNFVSQLFGGFDCEFLNCVISASTQVAIPASATNVDGIDFELSPGGRVSGQILGLVDNELASVRIWTPDEGRLIGSYLAFPEANWAYLIEGISGSFIIEIDPQPSTQTNALRILNDGTLCPLAGCDRADGVPINFAPESSNEINFSLRRGGRIEGMLTDAETGLAIDGQFTANISIVDVNDRVAGAAFIDSSGNIVSGDGIAPGTYFIKTGLPFSASMFSGQQRGFSGSSSPYVDQLLLGVDCQGLACDLADEGALPITISADTVTTGVDFALRLGNRISGRVTDASTGAALEGRNVEIFTNGGRRVGLEITTSNGSWGSGGLPDGDYRVVVKDGGRLSLGVYGFDGLGYFGQVYGNPTNCMQDLCSPSTGTNVTVAGADVSDIDVALNRGPTISGRVVDTDRGLPILLTVDVFDESARKVGSWTTLASDDATYTTGALIPGTYSLVPRTTKTYSIGSSTIAGAKGDAGLAGTLTIELGDADITDASMGVFQSLLFADDFESN